MRLIWQLWTCVLSISDMNFIVGYIATPKLFIFLLFLYDVVVKKLMLAISSADELLVNIWAFTFQQPTF